MNDSHGFKVSCGWGDVSNDVIHFNFRLDYERTEWSELIEYQFLVMLSECVGSNCETTSSLQFPQIDENLRTLIVFHHKSPGLPVSMDFLSKMERTRKTMELWISEILNQITSVDDETKQWCKQLFFRSPEKILIFERICSPNDQPLPPPSSSTSSAVEDVNSVVKKRSKSIYTKVTHKLMKEYKSLSKTDVLSESNLQEQNNKQANQQTDKMESLSLTVPKAPTVGYAASANGHNLNSPTAADSGNATNPGSKTGKATRRFTMIASLRGSGRLKSSSSGDGSKTDATAEEEADRSLLQVEVQRGGSEVLKSGVLVYDVILRVFSKKYKTPVVYSTFQRYSNFRALYDKLVEVSGTGDATVSRTVSDEKSGEAIAAEAIAAKSLSSSKGFMNLINVPFPSKTSVFGLSDTELSERTRNLDSWFREICTYYRYMPSVAKNEVRAFLKFDLSRPKDIYIQDQLTWGAIDGPPGGGQGGSSVLIVQRSALENMSDEVLEAMSVVDGTAPSSSHTHSPRRASIAVTSTAVTPTAAVVGAVRTPVSAGGGAQKRNSFSHSAGGSEVQPTLTETASVSWMSKGKR